MRKLERCYHRCVFCHHYWDHAVAIGAPLDDYNEPCPECRAAGRTVHTRKPRPVTPGESLASLPSNIEKFLETGDQHLVEVIES